MIAVGYVRRSKKSEARAVSLDEQRRHITEYCEKAGLTLAHVVSHDGVSGTKRKRFPDIRKAIKDHGAGAVVVYNLDRLARDTEGLLGEFKSYRKAGVQLYESTSGLIGDSALDQLMLTIRSGLDEFYAKVTGQKTSGALQLLKSEGRQYTRIPPFGYAYFKGRLVREPDEQAAILMIQNRDDLTAAGILAVVRESGYTGRLSVNTVWRVLRGEINYVTRDGHE